MEIIRKAFDTIAETVYPKPNGRRRRVGPTATVKIMHFINPNLFMMNDIKIRKAYNCRPDDAGYASFMLKTKGFLPAQY
ncbi:MAG TPA: hypothetical protein VNI77_00490 [Nitrososphaera sp.]|nr:hypothetical protein [Nitrososphaera sp.]